MSNDASSTVVATITNNERMRAVLLYEWFKELAAIAQEQSIVMLADTFTNHF